MWTGSKRPISWALLTLSRYALPRPRSHATGRSPHSADPFGQNGWFTISSFLVTKLEQHRSVCSSPILMSQQLLRRLVSCDYCCNNTKPSPWSHIELHLLRPQSTSLDSSSGTVPWAHINTLDTPVWLRARDGVEFSLPAFLPTGGRSTSGPASLYRDAGERVLRGRSCPAPRSLVVCQCWAVSWLLFWTSGAALQVRDMRGFASLLTSCVSFFSAILRMCVFSHFTKIRITILVRIIYDGGGKKTGVGRSGLGWPRGCILVAPCFSFSF